jgi:hypothetical protein
MAHTHFMPRRRLQPIWRERDGMVGPNGLIGVPLRGKTHEAFGCGAYLSQVY